MLGLELYCMDLGLPCGTDGPGEGDAESRVNGLVRHLGPFTAGTDIAIAREAFNSPRNSALGNFTYEKKQHVYTHFLS